MWGYAILGLAMASTIAAMTRVSTKARLDTSRAQVQAVAGSMAVYRNTVVIYAQANASVTGTVADSALGLPSWYVKQSVVSHYVTGGKGYVYVAAPAADLAYILAKKLGGTINVGINQAGYLHSPFSLTNASTPIALPAAIPTGAAVIAP